MRANTKRTHNGLETSKASVIIIVAGLKGVGKTTVVKSLLSPNLISESEILKENTFCQLILTSSVGNITRIKEVFMEHLEGSSVMSERVQIGRPVNVIPEYEADILLCNDLLVGYFNHSIPIKLIDTVGFGDITTDSANRNWQRSNSKYSNVFIFVTSEGECFREIEEINILRNTLQDLKENHCYRIENFPKFIIIINMHVTRLTTEKSMYEIHKLISYCQSIVEKILADLDLLNVSVVFEVLYAKKVLIYNKFCSQLSFSKMSPQEIGFIAYQELGNEGEMIARNSATLRSILKRRFTKNSSWKTKTGFSKLINLIKEQMVKEEAQEEFLVRHIRLRFVAASIKEFSIIEACMKNIPSLVYRVFSEYTTINLNKQLESEIFEQVIFYINKKLKVANFIVGYRLAFRELLLNAFQKVNALRAYLYLHVIEVIETPLPREEILWATELVSSRNKNISGKNNSIDKVTRTASFKPKFTNESLSYVSELHKKDSHKSEINNHEHEESFDTDYHPTTSVNDCVVDWFLSVKELICGYIDDTDHNIGKHNMNSGNENLVDISSNANEVIEGKSSFNLYRQCVMNHSAIQVEKQLIGLLIWILNRSKHLKKDKSDFLDKSADQLWPMYLFICNFRPFSSCFSNKYSHTS